MTEHRPTPTNPRDWWVSLGLLVSATAALLSSFDGLHSLARLAGWSPLMAPLLPLTVDAYAMTATRVWLAGTATSARARRFARSNAIGAIGLSLAGNATAHLIRADLLTSNWVVVLGVGAVPPVVLGLVSHLAVLRGQGDVVRQAVDTAPPMEAAHRAAAPVDLLSAARTADAAFRAHHGRPITRDALRTELRVGAARAGAVLRQLRANTPPQLSTDLSENHTLLIPRLDEHAKYRHKD